MSKQLSAEQKKQLARQRREAARQAQKYHREQEKRAKKSSAKPKPQKKSHSKIEAAVNAGKTRQYERMSREEKFRREGKERIKNLRPRDFEDGYYIDEYGEKQRQERRAKVIRKQETEAIRRNKRPMTRKQARNRRIIVSAAILLAVMTVGAILSLTVLFKTEKIEVEGDSYYYPDQIIAFSNVAPQQNIFLAKFGSTPEEIVGNLAYIEEASVSFAVPDTVVISVVDAVPTYAVPTPDGYMILSAKGRVLDITPENQDNLTELICGEFSHAGKGSYISFADSSTLDMIAAVAETVRTVGIANIRAIDITDTANITLNYNNQISINIGIAEDLEYKLKTANIIITTKLDPNNTGKIYGVLDVSTCNKNKMSHYTPSATEPTTPEPTAVTEPTQPAENTQQADNNNADTADRTERSEDEDEDDSDRDENDDEDEDSSDEESSDTDEEDEESADEETSRDDSDETSGSEDEESSETDGDEESAGDENDEEESAGDAENGDDADGESGE